MFLEMLKDNQKELFLQLAIMAAKASGKIEAAEHEMLIQKDMREDDMWLPW